MRTSEHPPVRKLLLLVSLLGLTAPPLAEAQAILRGRVIDSEVGQPLPRATVRVGNDTILVATTDSQGFFQASGLRPGMNDIRIQALGFEEGIFKIFIPDSGQLYRQFALDFNGFMLPQVVVQARAEALQSRYIDFERRRTRKLGAFLRSTAVRS